MDQVGRLRASAARIASTMAWITWSRSARLIWGEREKVFMSLFTQHMDATPRRAPHLLQLRHAKITILHNDLYSDVQLNRSQNIRPSWSSARLDACLHKYCRASVAVGGAEGRRMFTKPPKGHLGYDEGNPTSMTSRGSVFRKLRDQMSTHLA